MHNIVSDLLAPCTMHIIGVTGLPSKALKANFVYWLTPTIGWIKLNIDGAAAINPGRADCEGIFGTARGFIKVCFYYPLEVSASFQAKIWGVIIAINFAKKFSWNFIWLERDSMSVVCKLLQAQSLLVFGRCYQSGGFVFSILFSFILKLFILYREGNMVVDVLLKMALSSCSSFWSFYPPEDYWYVRDKNMWGDSSFHFCLVSLS